MAEKVTGGQFALVGAVLLGGAFVTYDSLKEEAPQTAIGAKAEGTRLEHNVFRVKNPDGGASAYVAVKPDGGITKLVQSPCARRPTGVDKFACLALFEDGGTYEQGDENTMQPGRWVGPGCVPTACTTFAGEQPETGAAK